MATPPGGNLLECEGAPLEKGTGGSYAMKRTTTPSAANEHEGWYHHGRAIEAPQNTFSAAAAFHKY